MNSDYKQRNRPDKQSRYRQGYYKLVNPEKYKGNPTEIIYRSSYEYKFCRYCDLTDDIISWSSEPFAIKYFNPITQKLANYHIDFYMSVMKDGEEKKYLVEIKPKSKLKAPVFEGRQTVNRVRNFNYEAEEFLINSAKARSAEQYANTMGYKYLIITEEFLDTHAVP